MKIIVTIIPTYLVTNLLLSYFFRFLQTKNKNLVFNKFIILQQEVFLFFDIASCALLQSHAEFNRLCERIFLHLIPICILVPCFDIDHVTIHYSDNRRSNLINILFVLLVRSIEVSCKRISLSCGKVY